MTINRAILGCLLAAALQGCATAAVPVSPTTPASATLRTNLSGSSLLYVANVGSASVPFYGYSRGTVGSMQGNISDDAAAVCSDKDGNVFVASTASHSLRKYLRGSEKAIQIVRIPTGIASACAVDPSTGQIAVSIQTPYGKFYKGGEVKIWTPGQRRSERYISDQGFAQTLFVAYDDAGDLFVDAYACGSLECAYGSESGPPGLYELTPGAQHFGQVNLNGLKLRSPSGIAWIKPALLLTDNDYHQKGGPVGIKLTISGGEANVTGTIPFVKSRGVAGITVRADVAIVADTATNAVRSYSVRSGSLLSEFTGGISNPQAVAVSQARAKSDMGASK